MNNDVDKELSSLREKYLKNLPNKIQEIENLVNQIKMTPEVNTIKILHRLLHNLHGSAGTYGFPQISHEAGEMETKLKNILEKQAWKDIENSHFEESIEKIKKDIKIGN